MTEHRFGPHIAEARVTFPVVPFQVEGRIWDGPWFYFRHRNGITSIAVGESTDDAAEIVAHLKPGPLIELDTVAWAEDDEEGAALVRHMLRLMILGPGHPGVSLDYQA